MNNSVPVLSDNEPKLVKNFRGILSASRGVRDMNEAWLAEAGLSPTPWGIGSVTPSTTGASLAVEVAVFMAEKCPGTDEDANLRKRNKMVAFEQLVGAVWSTTKAPAEKGKEPARQGKESAEKGKEPVAVEEV
ncbi:hypothetical protein GW17_00062207, partial [Ensete ventricosum]